MRIKNILAMSILASCGLIVNEMYAINKNKLKIDIAKICTPQNTKTVHDFIFCHQEKQKIDLWVRDKDYAKIVSLAPEVL